MTRVVLIGHFSNEEVRSNLSLDNRRFYALMRKVLRLPAKSGKYVDIAPWFTQIVIHLSKRKDIELHVISAQTGLKKNSQSFKIDNVNYHFVKADYATLLKRIVKSDSIWRFINPMRLLVKNIVRQIRPDIVNLIGAENAYISGTILDVKDFPIYVLCQTIYNNPNRSKYGEVDSKNASTERLIFDKESYFGVYSKMHYDLLKEIKPNAEIFNFNWPSVGYPEVQEKASKQFDFVNFALSLSFNKGFHDSVKALAIVKKKFPDVKLNLIGGGDAGVKQELIDLVNSLDLSANVVFTPSFEKQEDMFQHLQNSRFAVLPCKMDNISGTMMQSMHYGLPLVVYKTPGTPSLNKDKECVLIAEHSNVEELAKHMLYLMDNPDKADILKLNSKEQIDSMTDNDKIIDKLVSDYKAIIQNYKHNTPIPKELLFKTEG